MNRFASLIALTFSIFVYSASAQLALSNATQSRTIDFSSTVPGVSNGTYTGTGFQAAPAPGQLDSDAWRVNGWSDGSLTYGGTATSGDLARGATSAAVTTGGFYAYTGAPGSPANPSFLFQPGGADFAPGLLVLKIQNTGVSNITTIQARYTIFIRNDEGRANSLNFAFSPNDSTSIPVPSQNYTSPEAADALGYRAVASRSIATNVNIPPGGFYYFWWQTGDVSGAGARDEIAIDNIVVTGTFVPLTWTVDTIVDENDGSCTDGDCSLRDAIELANEGDIVAFSALFNTPQTIVLSSDLVVNKDITITGPGANKLTIDGGPGANRIFTLDGTITLSGMKLTGGNGNLASGGAILGIGNITLNGMHITGNTALDGGAAHLSFGNSRITASTISGNTATREGGGIRADSVFTLVIVNSTISGNSAFYGGALYMNAIFSGSGSSIGTVRNSTITNNSAVSTGGLMALSQTSDSLTLSLGSSMVAGNTTTGSAVPPEFSGSVTSAGFNLIGDAPGDSPMSFIYQPTDIRDTDPMIGPLADNGGPTPTHMPASLSSPLLDKGSAFGTTTDQRGTTRPIDILSIPNAAGGDGSDIGSFEVLAPTAAGVSLSGRVLTPYGTGIRGAKVTLSGGNLAEPVTVWTTSFGYFAFDGIESGHTYIVTVEAGKYVLAEPSRVVNVVDDVADFNFVAEPR